MLESPAILTTGGKFSVRQSPAVLAPLRTYAHLNRAVARWQVGRLEIDLDESHEARGHARKQNWRVHAADSHGGQ